ncbi:hypothetical protein WMF26_02470 [Sorangium sp. So ce185]|uniref:hypothetical protein n=1 Tax=Sorangium sp. So ce185 TaxID=3133287 RepID=UPI003F63E608
MIHREILGDGSIRLAKDGCSFVFRRLRPGAVLVTIAGRDTGGLGDAPLDELQAEIARYPPVELYVDARDATFAAESVSDAWTRFFSANRDRLRRVRILVGTPFVQLVVDVAKLFSRTGELIQIESDARRFDEAVASAAPARAPSQPGLPHAAEPARIAEPAVAPGAAPAGIAGATASTAIRREVLADGAVQLANDRCSYTFRRLRPGVMLIAIAGHDGGEFGELPLDEIRKEIARFGPAALFVDVRAVTVAAPSVSDAWTAFFAANRATISRVRILVGSKLLQLVVALSKEASRTGDMIQIDDDPERFQAALAREAAPERPAPRGPSRP